MELRDDLSVGDRILLLYYLMERGFPTQVTTTEEEEEAVARILNESEDDIREAIVELRRKGYLGLVSEEK